MPDLPGFGESPPLCAGTHDIAGYAAWTARFVAAVAPAHGGTAGVVLLGHSFGSIVASAAVADGLPVRALVLVTPIAGSALARTPRAATVRRWSTRWVMTRATVLLHRAAATLPESVGTAVLRSRLFTRVASVAMVKTRDRALRRWIHAEHDRYFGGFADLRVLLEAFEASVSHGVDETAARVTVPTLLVATELDDITTPAEQRRLAEVFPHARLETVDGTGHLVHYERPDAVAAAVHRLLDQL